MSSRAASAIAGLAHISPAGIQAYVSSNRAELRTLLGGGVSASVVNSAWSGMNAAQQRSAVAADPQVFGNLNGIPYTVRARANSISLRASIASAEKQSTTQLGKGARYASDQQLVTLRNIAAALHSSDGVSRSLITFRTGDGSSTTAAIVAGDLSTAHYVSVLVPGMYMSVQSQIVAWSSTAAAQYSLQKKWLRTTHTGDAADAGVAVVAWIGYQTPDLMNIGSLKLAQQGAENLQGLLLGIQNLRAGDEPYLTVMAHSYGSTAALMALSTGSVHVDALALVGSPGSAAQSVAALDVTSGQVWVGDASMDPIVHTAFYGSDPSSPSYGARPLSVTGGVDPITGEHLTGSSGHNDYFTPGTESMRNLALIAIDEGHDVIS